MQCFFLLGDLYLGITHHRYHVWLKTMVYLGQVRSFFPCEIKGA